MNPAKPPVETLVDGVVVSSQSSSAAKPSKQPNSSTTNPSTPTIFIEVNAIESMQTPDNKEKGKGKNKKT